MALQTHQPSSSTSSPSSSEYYDVFLSFSGKDTFNTFTSHLYYALCQSGLQTYMANEDLREGDEIWPSLEKAITGSRISIPIFSLNYASSKWCLDELLKIMEIRETKGQTVYPVFFHVDPRDVRKQSGDFGKKFDELTQRFDQEIVDKWKTALRKTGELKGWDLKNIENGNESMLIQKVVKKLRETPFDVPENLVGIDLCVEELLNLLNLQSTDVKFVGIWGMGGIGKTTAAEVVFNQIRHSFEASFFLQDIREASIPCKGLVCLQNKLLSVILNQELKSISSVNEGKSFIKKRLHLKKVLIVLDDVDNIEQLDALAGQPDWFGHGSRIIITSRDEHVLNVHKVHGIYEAKELDFPPSLYLFSKHAFGKDQPPDDFLKLAKEVVHIAGGLPLALKVLGSFLFDKRSTTVWSSTLERLKKIPHNDIKKKLKISYDGLDHLDKEIFLDVACFFIGIDKEYATYIWEGCGFSAMLGIENLIQKSLVKIGNENELRMHDQLRDVGRNIVCQESPNEPGKRSRLWSHDEAMNVLRGQEGTRNVRGLILEFEEDKTTSEDMHLRTAAFSAMSKLRLLQIDNAVLIGGFKKFPLGLRWLSWKRCPLASIPVNFCVEKLVVLDLSWSRIKQVWDDWPQNKLEELKVLNLSGCKLLTETPDFSRLPNLQKLDLEGCIKLTELPPSLCNLKSLKNLSLSGCSNLYRLPNSIGNLRNLKTFFLDKTSISELPDVVGLMEKMEKLSVKGCSNLVKLPDSMGKMRLLREFSMDGTHIVKLPEDFAMLSSLEELSFSNCREFRDFTENFSRLPNLEKLNLQGCTELTELPPSICKLKSLKKLILSSCSNLNKLPDMFGFLEELEVIELDGCKLLCKLPDSIGNLRNLKIFSLKRCSNLVKLPVSMGKMRLLRGFFIDGTGIVKLPQDFGMLSSLMELSMSDCREFTGFPENFSRLPKLKKLNLKGCIELKELPCSICEMKSLKNLNISSSNLNKVEEIVGSLTELEVVNLNNCKLLGRSLGWIGNMRFLTILSLNDTSITELPNAVGSLEKIEYLSVENCSNLVKLPDSMGKMKRLRDFSISKSSIVKLPEDFGMLSSLEGLSICYCREFRGFPENFGSLTRLFSLNLDGNSKMGILPSSLSGLCSLEYLRAPGCNLSEGGIPTDIGKLSSLSWLDLSYNNFSSLPEMPTTLEEIDVENCISLKSLPDLSDLKHLSRLNISNCEKLAEIQGIENVKKYLEELWVSGCSGALVNSVKKSFGQGGLLPQLKCFSFDGSKIPDCFIPLKISSRRGECGRLEWEIGPTRLWNPEQHQNLITCVLCFVLTKTPEEKLINLCYDIIDRNGQILLPEIGNTISIRPSKRHQVQIHKFDWGRYSFGFLSLVKQGFEIKFKMREFSRHGMEVVVKEAGVHLVYEETAESTYKRIANAISLSLHDDDDDDRGEASSSTRKRKMFQLLYLDGKDADRAEASSSSSRKRTKLQLMHHDDDDEILASLLGKMVLT